MADAGERASDPYTKSSVRLVRSGLAAGAAGCLQLVIQNRDAAATTRATLSDCRMYFLQIFGFAEFRTFPVATDVPQQSGEHAARANFDKSPDSQRR